MTHIIIQARVGSTRLKNKTLLKVKEKSMLEILVERLKKCKKASKIIVAIPDTKENKILQDVCKQLQVECFLGSEQNVLQRSYFAAKHFHSKVIVRITSDCPLMDHELVDAMIDTFKAKGKDYITTCQSKCLPRGLDVEVFSFDALKKAYHMAVEKAHLEHVTLIMKESDQFTKQVITHPFEHAHLRLTLDTQEDFNLLKLLLENLELKCSMLDVFDFLEKNPNIAILNQHVEQKRVR